MAGVREAVGRRLVTADRGHRGRADRRTGQAEVEWNAKKERDEAAGERVSGSGRPTEARGAPIANGTDGTNARVASLFPPANRVKSPCPPRSEICREPQLEPAALDRAICSLSSRLPLPCLR